MSVFFRFHASFWGQSKNVMVICLVVLEILGMPLSCQKGQLPLTVKQFIVTLPPIWHTIHLPTPYSRLVS